jgi:hypothetical protein
MEGLLFDIEPEPEPAPRTIEPAPAELSLMRVLPADFPLATLLTFLPDVKLKQRVEAAAAAALAIDVTAEGGLVRADEALVPVRAGLKEIDEGFRLPCDIANKLHKRLTGLRADFMGAGEDAVRSVGRAIYNEHVRLQHLADEAKRKAQEDADRQAREEAQRAADQAKKSAAPAAVVAVLEQRAAAATAPPVATTAPAPKLQHSSAVAKWRARLRGTLPGADPHPATKELTLPQQEALLELLKAIVEGKPGASLALIEVNWATADKRASADGTTMAIPGLEAFDEGGTRAKGRR